MFIILFKLGHYPTAVPFRFRLQPPQALREAALKATARVREWPRLGLAAGLSMKEKVEEKNASGVEYPNSEQSTCWKRATQLSTLARQALIQPSHLSNRARWYLVPSALP